MTVTKMLLYNVLLYFKIWVKSLKNQVQICKDGEKKKQSTPEHDPEVVFPGAQTTAGGRSDSFWQWVISN